MNARNGKIARLPRSVRDELNERLECSEESPQLLHWLNALPEVMAVVKKDFAGVPISKQNLSEWRQGGFQEWRLRQELWAEALNMQTFAEELGEERDNVVADDVATVLAARYAALISKWDGEVDEKFEAKARVLNGLCRAVVQLQRGMHRAKKNNEDYICGLEEEFQKQREKMKNKRLERMYSLLREPQVAQAFGGGELGAKIAKYIIQVENDVPGAKLELTGDEQTEKHERKPVKPTRKRRARKTRMKKANKPLEENEIDAANEDQSGPAESDSVKVNPTGFAKGEASFGSKGNRIDLPPDVTENPPALISTRIGP